VFLPVLLAAASGIGRSIYPDAGAARTSALHVDAAQAPMWQRSSAAEQVRSTMSPRRGADDPTNLGVSGGSAGGVPSLSVSIKEAAAVLDPFTAMFLTVNNGSTLARPATR
jgi:hypothetical protein